MAALHKVEVTFVSERANITKLLLISLFWHSDQSKLQPVTPHPLLRMFQGFCILVTYQKCYYIVDLTLYSYYH